MPIPGTPGFPHAIGRLEKTNKLIICINVEFKREIAKFFIGQNGMN
jgi:hypothetical protein